MARVEVTMPKMGESITEGTVISWHKKPGEAVELDETLLEIGTDKVDTDVPSPAAGILAEVLVEEGQTVDVGTPLAYLETEAEAVAESEPAGAPPEQAPAETDQGDPAASAAANGSRQAATESAEAAPGTQDTSTGERVREEPPDAAQSEVAEQPPAEAAEPHLDVRPTGGGEVQVVMPKMGESITEGTVIAWHKKPGETIEQDETLLEIATDKVDTEVPSPAAGVLKEILVQENETVEVGTPVAVIATEAEAGTAEPAAPAAEPSREEEPVRQVEKPAGDGAVRQPQPAGEIPRKGEDGRFYSPLVRSIAEKEGLSLQELQSIRGSGRDGRVTKADVLEYIRSGRKADTAAPAEQPKPQPAPSRQPAPKAPTPQPAAGGTVSGGDGLEGRVEIIKMDRMRQIIAEHMVRSKATSAHVTSFAEADVTNLVRFRETNKDAFFEREGVKLTYTPFFVQAAVEALRDHPILNASVEEDQIIIKKDLHIGIAVAIGKTGLVAPVIRNAGQKSLSGLAHAAADLADRARSKQLQPDELQGGTFTITNIGSLGSIMGTPIINQPQVAILAIGAIKKRPVVIEDPELGDIIAVRHMVYLSLSYDHRIIDGAMAASFLQRFVASLESISPDHEL